MNFVYRNAYEAYAEETRILGKYALSETASVV
jgi:hypothetical protein